ncbi:Hypothetical predicted protein [Mytilus galloprovincialis]|uniref:Uncharacterized protein n=1 Tax=Mytilus galloprovincialis TaxID=29158 RepID=A0A8B6H6I4_MYTGA|nr:Hypothetical predicted protein [Mytilus galloprovincialis]
MSPVMFDEIVNRVGPRVKKTDTLFRRSLSPGLKIAITLRHLATGDKTKRAYYRTKVHNERIEEQKTVPALYTTTAIWVNVKICFTTVHVGEHYIFNRPIGYFLGNPYRAVDVLAIV